MPVACLFSPSETGGLGLMDTTGETGDASLTACMAEAQQYFCRRQIYQKPKGVNRISGEAEYRRSRELHGVPRKERTGARLVPEAGVRGKVLRFRGKSVHFPPKKTDVRLPDQYDREHSFVFHVAGLELFMKTAGATANRQIYTKHCKSMHHANRSNRS